MEQRALRQRQPSPTHPIPQALALRRLFLAFLKLGATAFGGPAMLAYMRTVVVEQQHWLAEEPFQAGVALCQTIPGATAMQMTAYIGFRLRGVAGAAVSFLGFGLPAFLLIVDCRITFRFQTHKISRFLTLWDIKTGTFRHISFPCIP